MTSELFLAQDDVVQTLLGLAEVPMLVLGPNFDVIDFSPQTLRLFPRLEKNQKLTRALDDEFSAPLFKLMESCDRSSGPAPGRAPAGHPGQLHPGPGTIRARTSLSAASVYR